MAKKARRQRRSIEQQIADLQAKITAIQEREALRRAKTDPVLRNVATALKGVEKALALEPEAPTAEVLQQVHTLLAGLMEGEAPVMPARRGRRAAAKEDLPAQILAHLRDQPAQRSEQIASALGTDTATLRPVLKRLIADGKVETEGQKRGMTYSLV